MGKQIRIHLADGSPTGIRHAEITNWTGQALACPRHAVKDLQTWEALKRPGVYFLFGQDEMGDNAVYIGEAESVLIRIAVHIKEKEFWNELVAFTSKDSNLTKSHIRYLEARLVEKVQSAKRYRCLNGNAPQGASLPRADQDAMDEYLDSLEILLGVLGHRILQTNHAVSTHRMTIIPHSTQIDQATQHALFTLKTKNTEATALYTDEGLLVLAGSEAAINNLKQPKNNGFLLKEQLKKNQILQEKENKFVFMQDYLFSSPSSAAGIIVGYSINGRTAWKLANGKTYADYEADISQSLLNQN